MAEELKEREVFEAHMRVGGYSNHDKHPDGSYVSSAMELWWQGWKARAQLPSQGGEAVAWHTEDQLTDKSATTYDPEVAKRWRAKGWPVTPLYTHPADQVADDLTMVKVSRELLERIVKRGMRLPDETQHQHLEELRALLAKS